MPVFSIDRVALATDLSAWDPKPSRRSVLRVRLGIRKQLDVVKLAEIQV